MNTIRLSAFAKLNLTLDVLGKDALGYHSIDSLVTTVDLFDRIVVRRRRDKKISLTMHGLGSEGIPPEKNNAYLAAEHFSERFKTAGAEITVYKNIPIGAGLGGSSADAAGVLRALSKLYGIEDFSALKELADKLGSDTGYLLTGGARRLRGRGERVEKVGPFPPMHFLLLCPRANVSTKLCYQASDEFPPAEPQTERALSYLLKGNLKEAAGFFSNGLYPAAKKLCPAVERAKEELESFSPLATCMTGSGSGVFALFESEELCAWAKSRYRGKSRAYILKTAESRTRKRIKNPFVLGEEEGKEENAEYEEQ